MITSGKGGVGKTTVCVNLGTIISNIGYRVLLVDGDFGLNNLDIVMGMENKIIYDIFDVLQGRCRARQAVITDFFNDNLSILPATKFVNSRAVMASDILRIIDELDTYFDYILIDCPAGIDQGFVRVLNLASEALVVTTPHISAVRDAEKVINILRNSGYSVLNYVLNRARGDLILSGESLSISSISEFLGINLIGVIPEDDEISNQLMIGGSITKGTDAFYAFRSLANNLAKGKSDIFDCTKKYKGTMGYFRRILRKIV